MKTEVETISINGVEYVRADSVKTPEYCKDYHIVRTYSAGVFAGEIVRRDGKEVEMTNARRLWYWDGACSLSQMAMEGVTAPQNCKFAMPVDVILTEVIEILKCTDKAKKVISEVAIWKR